MKSILEQYFQVFSEYTESPILFANLDQKTNKSNLSASEKNMYLKPEADIRIHSCLDSMGQNTSNGGNQSKVQKYYFASSQ